jgi:hypothetical protein
MVGRQWLLALAGAAVLVTACASGKAASPPSSAPAPTAEPTTSAAPTTTLPTAHTVPPLSIAVTTLPPITRPPGAPTSTQPVTTVPRTTVPRTHCLTGPTPPSGAKNVQGVAGDIDGDGAFDTIWVYDLPDGPHLQIHTARGASDALPLGFGKAAAAVGLLQVDYAPGTAAPGTEQEFMAIASQDDGTRLVGVYSYAKNTGCISGFQFGSGAAFVYLVSPNGTVSGLHCAYDGHSAHLEAVTAVPTGATTYAANRLVFGKDGHRLVPVLQSGGTLTLPRDQAALATDGNVTGCILSRPIF